MSFAGMKYLREIKYGSGNMMSTPPPPPPPPPPGPGPSAPPTNQMQQDYENDLRMDELEDEINAIDEEIDNLNDLFKPGIRDTWSRTPEELDLYKQQMSEEMFNLIDIRAKLESEWRHRQRFGFGIYSGGMMQPPAPPPPPPPPGGGPSMRDFHEVEEFIDPLESAMYTLKLAQKNLRLKENNLKFDQPTLDRANANFDRAIQNVFQLMGVPLTNAHESNIKNASGELEIYAYINNLNPGNVIYTKNSKEKKRQREAIQGLLGYKDSQRPRNPPRPPPPPPGAAGPS
jgi:hypothetical protein